MKVLECLKGIGGELLLGDPGIEVDEVAYDSRKAAGDCVFVCMKGTKVDSHDFVGQVLSAGCRCLVVEERLEEITARVLGLPEDVTVIRVPTGRQALAYLAAARFGYPAEKMVCIGVTGTKGKTTTTYMIKAVLEAAGKKVGLIGTAGAVIGEATYPTLNTTPESSELQRYFARMVEEGCEYMIMEVSSQGLKMHRVDGITFDYGIFTNISNDHIGPDEHRDFEEYLYYKSQILKRCRVGIANRDDDHFQEIANEHSCRLYTYGLEGEGDFRARDIRYVAREDFVGVEFFAEGFWDMDVKVNIPGRFNVYNAMAALSVCSFLDLPRERVSHALEHLYVNGRMEIVHSSAKCTVIVDYAHNGVSMESLLGTLREYKPGRLVCVFGCGGNRSKDRRYSMGEIGGRLADLCILTADNSRYEKTEDIIADIRGSVEKAGGTYVEIPDRREAIAYSILNARPGDMIAVIGKGHEDYQEENGVRKPFLDRQVIQEVIAGQGAEHVRQHHH